MSLPRIRDIKPSEVTAFVFPTNGSGVGLHKSGLNTVMVSVFRLDSSAE